ncbi:SycD/LcrH family type III secretion system chaperone [Aeromonas aquatilis]
MKMNSEQDMTEKALEAFIEEGGTLAMLNQVSSDTLEQLYTFGFNQYDAGKYDEAHKIFQTLCVLDHYEARFFLGLGACRQALGQHQLAIDSYSYGAIMDLNEPRFPFHAAECLLQMGELEGAESGFHSAQLIAAAKPELAALAARAGVMLEVIKTQKDMEHESNQQ